MCELSKRENQSFNDNQKNGCTRSASGKNQSSRRASKALETGAVVPGDRFGYNLVVSLSAEQSGGDT